MSNLVVLSAMGGRVNAPSASGSKSVSGISVLKAVTAATTAVTCTACPASASAQHTCMSGGAGASSFMSVSEKKDNHFYVDAASRKPEFNTCTSSCEAVGESTTVVMPSGRRDGKGGMPRTINLNVRVNTKSTCCGKGGCNCAGASSKNVAGVASAGVNGAMVEELTKYVAGNMIAQQQAAAAAAAAAAQPQQQILMRGAEPAYRAATAQYAVLTTTQQQQQVQVAPAAQAAVQVQPVQVQQAPSLQLQQVQLPQVQQVQLPQLQLQATPQPPAARQITLQAAAVQLARPAAPQNLVLQLQQASPAPAPAATANFVQLAPATAQAAPVGASPVYITTQQQEYTTTTERVITAPGAGGDRDGACAVVETNGSNQTVAVALGKTPGTAAVTTKNGVNSTVVQLAAYGGKDGPGAPSGAGFAEALHLARKEGMRIGAKRGVAKYKDTLTFVEREPKGLGKTPMGSRRRSVSWRDGRRGGSSSSSIGSTYSGLSSMSTSVGSRSGSSSGSSSSYGSSSGGSSSSSYGSSSGSYSSSS